MKAVLKSSLQFLCAALILCRPTLAQDDKLEPVRTTASAGVRSFSSQFDDDRNQFLLPGFATVQLYAQRRLAKNFSALLEFENLLDRQYLTAFSPTPAIGTPRLWRAGLRWDGSL